MCQFMSGVITKNKTWFDLDQDSHEFLITKAGLKDKTNSPDFVRVELLPKDNNIFNHNMSNWQIKVDQDFRPDWFSEKFAEAEMKKALKVLIAERFIINSNKLEERRDQRIFVAKSKVKVYKCVVQARGNSSVEAWGNSSVVARENSSVVARGNSSVVAWENSSIIIPNYSWTTNNAKIKDIQDFASVKDLRVNKIFVAAKELKLELFKA